MPADEAILAAPEAFAAFYRRHVDALLADLRRRTPAHAAELCAETFAVALDDAARFASSRARADAWLAGLAERQVDHLDRHGAVDERARRHLGMAALQDGERFVDDLEEELVEAARYVATRRRRRRPRVGLPRIGLPRIGPRALAAIAAVALAGVAVALLARTDGGDDATGDAPPPPPPNAVFSLLAMQPLKRCPAPARAPLPDSGEFDGIGLLDRVRRPADRLPLSPRRLPIGTFDRRATRAAASAGMHVVPSMRVAAFGDCGADDGPGVCLVSQEGSFRCFAISDVHGGRAVARTPDGVVVGIVPDGVGRVTLSAAGHTVGAEVVENVFAARLEATRGTQVEIAMQRVDDCERVVAPELRRQVAALAEPAPPTVALPAAVLGVVRAWADQIDAVVAGGARLWGTRDGVDFWVVPVVPGGRGRCAPATRVCVVAVPRDTFADGQCVLGADEDEEWRLAPLLPGRAAIYGVVPDGVTRARVTIGDVTGEVDARAGVVGGVLPFPYSDSAETHVELLR